MRQDDGETVNFKPANIPEFMNMWISWRIEFEKRVISRLIGIESNKQKIQEWLLFAILHKKEIINSLEQRDPETFLIRRLKIEKDHAQYILDLKVRNLASIEEGEVKNKIKIHKDKATSLKRELKKPAERIASNL
jgi:DNA gyrase/topoisomerase IV subunit A